MEAPRVPDIGEIIEHLAETERPVKSAELAELSNIDASALAALRDAWRGIPPERRKQITGRLVELSEDNAEFVFDDIFKFLLRDPDPGVRASAIQGLWESEDTTLIARFIQLLGQDPSEDVQAAAAAALGKFALLAEHRKLRQEHADHISRALLTVANNEAKTVEIRRRALEAVSPMSLSEVRTAIITAYRSPYARLRASAIYAMGRNCDVYWLPLLQKEAESDAAENRYEAATAMGELGEEEAVPVLVKLIRDPDASVQLAAVQSLGKIGGAFAKRCLLECRNSPSEGVREAAESALAELSGIDDPLNFRY